MIVLHARATAFEAARAMATNEIGAVVVTRGDAIAGIVTDRDLALRVVGEGRDPRSTTLAEVMSSDVVMLDPGASRADALRLMRERRVRRVPLVEKGRVVGMVTLDDLVLEDAITIDELGDVVRAQIIETGPARTRRFDEWRSLERRYSRALATWRRLVADLKAAIDLDTADDAERALEIVLAAIVRRLEPAPAKRLIARLPALVQARLRALPEGPDASVTRVAVERSIAAALAVKRARAADIAEAAGALLSRSIAPADLGFLGARAKVSAAAKGEAPPRRRSPARARGGRRRGARSSAPRSA